MFIRLFLDNICNQMFTFDVIKYLQMITSNDTQKRSSDSLCSSIKTQFDAVRMQKYLRAAITALSRQELSAI